MSFLNLIFRRRRLEWNFLFAVLRKFGFADRWISLIESMFSNCWFSLILNGVVTGYFHSTRGLRQGDPLAPTLFIIAEEVLSRGRSMAFSQRQITYYKVPRNCPKVTHLLFAYDTLVFKNGDKRSIQGLLQFNNLYEASSGQLVNSEKSCFVQQSSSWD